MPVTCIATPNDNTELSKILTLLITGIVVYCAIEIAGGNERNLCCE